MLDINFVKKLFFELYGKSININKNQCFTKNIKVSYINKRVYISGLLFASLFRDLYFRYKNYITYAINRNFEAEENLH